MSDWCHPFAAQRYQLDCEVVLTHLRSELLIVYCLVSVVPVGNPQARRRVGADRRRRAKALCGGIPGSFLEPLARSWSHFVGTYC